MRPEVGDIWRWAWDINRFSTVLIIEEIDKSEERYLCMDLEKGTIDSWGFRPNQMECWRRLV